MWIFSYLRWSKVEITPLCIDRTSTSFQNALLSEPNLVADKSCHEFATNFRYIFWESPHKKTCLFKNANLVQTHLFTDGIRIGIKQFPASLHDDSTIENSTLINKKSAKLHQSAGMQVNWNSFWDEMKRIRVTSLQFHKYSPSTVVRHISSAEIIAHYLRAMFVLSISKVKRLSYKA